MSRPASKRAVILRSRVRGIDAAIRSKLFQTVLHHARRQSATRDPIRFSFAEIFGERGRLAVHELTNGRLCVALRHRTRDVEIFDEIFAGKMGYEAPAPVAEILRRHPPTSVLDLGGNVGLFGVYALSLWPSASVTSVEPDEANLRVLERCVAANPGVSWNIVAACAGTREGTVTFCGGRFADSAIAFEGEANASPVRTIDVFELLATADFVKIDIEGGEWEILCDPRFGQSCPPVLVMEWHEQGCPRDVPQETARTLLRDAGYDVLGDDHGLGHGTLWAWRSPDAHHRGARPANPGDAVSLRPETEDRAT
jgi:FkbM family methyltransferase